ncbi:MAG TPA: formate dehydrogenase-N subunit alpha [Symbiobacteriaceae bacterium]|nr:formate dehydrogenase-N subunit alpha [Symbiobacteriaceae bacterium]
MAGLAATFGRGVMTNHWIDYKNSDVIIAVGANPAENHPMAMKWIDRAREQRGAKLVVIDPKFNRTAALADMYIPIRPGTDIALFGGIINYALANEKYFKEYVAAYTNAAFLVDPGFKFDEGLFSGAAVGADGQVKYDTKTWQFQKDEKGAYKLDPTFQDPNCVLQLMKKHYARYTPKMVSDTCGMSEADFLKLAELYTGTGKADKAGNILYAMGITQSTHGSQNVRSIAIVQLLLGNIGIAGGGVNAQRGESNVQGSTDMAMLFGNLPGYLPYPTAGAHPTLAKYNETTPKAGYWTNRPKFLASMLKAWWGAEATKENDFRYEWLPKLDARDHSHMSLFESMATGELKGLFAWGQNVAVGGPNVDRERKALGKLDWLVAVDLFDTETASFWRRPGVNPAEINTEVFLLPAAASFEKEGTVANSGRWIQYRWKAVEPLGEAKDDLWIADKLYKALKAEYEKGGTFPEPITKLVWNYGGEHPDVAKVALEVNGYNPADGKPLAMFTALKDDGTTACGNWIFSGYWADMEKPAAKSRVKEKDGGLGLNPQWSWAWPANRRIAYNRPSADPTGKPWDPQRSLVAWDGSKWNNADVPDFGWKDAATGAMIPPATSAAAPFIMNAEGKALLFSPSAMKDGPLPEHYEPVESPVTNRLNKRQFNPAVTISGKGDFGQLATVGDKQFPYICTTYRLTEHWQSGAMTRNTPWLGELMPDMFVELSESMAAKLGIKSGDRVTVSTLRGEVTAPAMVSARMKPVTVHGQVTEVVGMPWHWGYRGMFTGDSANMLTPHVGDANTNIPEYKAFLCNVTKAAGTGPVRR